MIIKQLLKNIIRPSGYTISRLNVKKNPQHLNQVTAEHFFDIFFSTINTKDFFFVEIGAHNGSFVDPIHKYIKQYNLAGILIEPQKDIFKELEHTYTEQNNLTFANIAISNEDGIRSLYTIKDSYKKDEFFLRGTGIASFDKEHFKRFLAHELRKRDVHADTEHLDTYIEEVSVPTLTFKTFTEKYNIQKIDLIQIDCEGYDFEIIQLIDFESFSPRIINYESAFLSEEDQIACEAFLVEKNYTCFRHGQDTCAFKT